MQQTGVFGAMDGDSKRYMDVLAASPDCCISCPCSRFIRIYLNATTSFSLDFQITAMVVKCTYIKNL